VEELNVGGGGGRRDGNEIESERGSRGSSGGFFGEKSAALRLEQKSEQKSEADQDSEEHSGGAEATGPTRLGQDEGRGREGRGAGEAEASQGEGKEVRSTKKLFSSTPWKVRSERKVK